MKTKIDRELEDLMMSNMDFTSRIDSIEGIFDKDYSRTEEILVIEKYLHRAKLGITEVLVALHQARKRIEKLPF